MAAKILRNWDYNQNEQQLVHPVQPTLFNPIDKLLEQLDSLAEDEKAQEEELVRACFKKICGTIRRRAEREIEKLQSNRPTRSQAAAMDDLRRHTYFLVREMTGLGWWPIIEELVHHNAPGRRSNNADTKRFNDVLRYIVTPEVEGSDPLLGVNARGDIANQLAYALKHGVPYQFLIGFLKEVGMDRAAREQRADHYEEWHPMAHSPAKPRTRRKSAG